MTDVFRLLFCDANDCSDRLLTAETDALYTTFDEMLSQRMPDGTGNKIHQILGKISWVRLILSCSCNCTNQFNLIWVTAKEFFCYWPYPRTYICMHVFCLTLPQVGWLGFFPNSFAATWNRSHGVSVAPLFWGTLIQDAVPTELPWRRLKRLNKQCRELEISNSSPLGDSSKIAWGPVSGAFHSKSWILNVLVSVVIEMLI